jgi:hypothetical protein
MASSAVPSISHILYIVPDSKGCELAMNIVKQYPALKKEVHMQDIKLIEKPAWLRGVPVLAKVATREIWEGSIAIEQLHYLAGYYSALQSVSTTSNQPWASYQTNLTLPQPIATQAPVQGSLPPVSSSISPPVVQPPSISVNPSPSISPPQNVPPPPSQIQSQPSVTLRGPQIQTPNRSETDQSDPNKVQPIPLPDDQRPQQEIALPPPPENIKKHSVQTTPLSTNSQTVSSPPPSLPSQPQTQTSRQPSRTPLANPNTVKSPPLASPSPPSESVEPSGPVDHVAVVFTPDELDTIQRVMFKPKTVNKRPNAHGSDEVFHVDETLVEELRGRGRDVNSPQSSENPSIREFHVAERTHSTIVQKDDGEFNGESEESQPTSA